MDQNTLHCCHGTYVIKEIKLADVGLHTYHVTLFSKTHQNLLFGLMDSLKACCQTILIRNIDF